MGKLIIQKPAHRPVRTELTPEQIRYIDLRMTTKLNLKQIAQMLNVHYNTVLNWNRSQLVQNALDEAVQQLKKENSVQMQKLMSSLIKQSIDVLDDPEMGNTIKVQLIGQLFTQAGRFAGLEPVKETKKEVKVTRSFEDLIEARVTDVE